MSKKVLFILGVLVIGLLVAACGGAASTSAPASSGSAAQPAATAASGAAAQPQPAATTQAAAGGAAATAPAAGGAAAGAVKAVPIKLWHGWTGAEADTLAQVVKDFEAATPGAKVDLLQVPFDQLKNKYTTEASTGGGPDLLIGPKDWIGELAQAKLIAALDDSAQQAGLNNLNKAAVDANKFQGKTYAFPESTEAVALFINKDKVKTAPKTADELLTMAQQNGLALNTNFYNSVGVLFAEGAKLFDAQGKCILDQGTGTVEGLKWMAKAKGTQNVIADTDGSKLDAAFKDGKAGMIFNGPWAVGDYVKALGQDKIAVVDPMTFAPANGKFAPFLGTKNLFLNANAKGDAKNTGLAFMNFLSQPKQQETFAKIGHIPSNPNVSTNDPILKGFLAQTQSTTYFPNEPEMGAVWTPAGDMITKVLEGKATPEDATKQACATINTANKKS